MPSSRWNHIPTVLNVVRQLAPRSILDVGTGFGKWGMLFREYTDIAGSESNPDRYHRPNWEVRIDGVEGFAEYVTPVHEYVYDQIHLGDMREVVPALGNYDVVFLGDVIEHVTKDEGRRLIADCLDRANRAVVLSTPAVDVPQEALCGNELEIHRSHWTAEDFGSLGAAQSVQLENEILLSVFVQPGVPVPQIHSRPVRSLGRRIKRSLRPIKPLLARLGVRRPRAEPPSTG
jgi:hypothetical protein